MSLSIPRARLVKDIFCSQPTAVAQFNNYDAVKQYPFKKVPEFLFSGRANVGKSSLINELLAAKTLVRSSSKPGATKTLNFYQPTTLDPKFYLVDGPGYGNRGRPEWGELFMTYATDRSTLRRIFILVNASHGLKESDKLMLQDLHSLALSSTAALSSRVFPFSFQIVLTKVDEIIKRKDASSGVLHSIQSEVHRLAPTCMPDMILTSTKMAAPGSDSKLGINELRECIVEAGSLL